ncbi:IS630 family transposase [Gemmata sp. JC673]|uniref:IS630 family transposase n=1 Tax=Gemmata algarum TaxID=2975278 RepID=A0ABU5F151_9BACT|nr:IS630 family transposase [Gemmata algarum]MDY3560562.1 IS630 family transposase [Gemmata algarum]
MGAIPLPPKKTIDEHRSAQAAFLRDQLEPVLAQARVRQRSVFFVDAAHFVQGSFLCCVWCLVRMFVRRTSGRWRYNVLGAWNGVTRERIRVTNETRVSSDTMVELMGRIAAHTTEPTTLVLDNARYQRCAAVEAEAKRLGIVLLFLPSYSPNLNVIERLWRFTKKKALRGKYYPDFATFRAAIDECLDRIPTDHREALASLMTLKFQTFDSDSFLTA